MTIVFDKDNIVEDLPGIITLSHGPVAKGILDTVNMLAGEQDNVAAFCLEEGDVLDEFREAFYEAYKAFPEGTICFCDLYGGSPSNELLRSSDVYPEMADVCAIAGMSVPMLITAVMSRDGLKGKELLNSVLDDTESFTVNLTEKIEEIRAM